MSNRMELSIATMLTWLGRGPVGAYKWRISDQPDRSHRERCFLASFGCSYHLPREVKTAQNRRSKAGKPSLTISAKPVGVGAVSQLWIPNGRTIWIADAHRDDGKRFVVHADEKLTAFLELVAATRSTGAAAAWDAASASVKVSVSE